MKNFIAKYSDELSFFGVCSLLIVADAELHKILAWLPVPIILFAMSAWGARIKKAQENKEL